MYICNDIWLEQSDFTHCACSNHDSVKELSSIQSDPITSQPLHHWQSKYLAD